MVNIEQVKNGFAKYIDNELTSKMSGMNRWVIGGVAGIAIIKAERIFHHLKHNAFIEMLDVIDDNDMIDIDVIYNSFLEQARKGVATLEIPLIGETKFNEHDIEMLYRYILGGD